MIKAPETKNFPPMIQNAQTNARLPHNRAIFAINKLLSDRFVSGFWCLMILSFVALSSLAAKPAWSLGSEHADHNLSYVRLTPSVPKSTYAHCKILLDAALSDADMKDVQPSQAINFRSRERAVPAAIYGMISGATYATGPRQAHKNLDDLARNELNLNNGSANHAALISAYKRCRTIAILQSQSDNAQRS
jgi:hypothetical protein